MSDDLITTPSTSRKYLPQNLQVYGPETPMPAPQAQAEPGAVQSFEPDTEGMNEELDSASAEDQFLRGTMPDFGGPQGPQGFVAPQMYDYSAFGPGGKQMFDRAYRQAPEQARQAAIGLADVEGQKADATDKALGVLKDQQASQFANIQANRIANQAEFAKRQAAYDEESKRVTADLADTGKFWRNPGNIISALGAALIAYGSPNDPSVGVKLINQQVMNDWNQRREASNQRLGELRSNVGVYRQIMGDKEAGDMMALAQSYKQASIDLQRIGAQFEGPLAKKRAEMLSADMESKAAVAAMDAHMKAVNKAPAPMNPEVWKRIQQSQQAFPGSAYTPINEVEGSKTKKPEGMGIGTDYDWGTGKSSTPPVSAAIRAASGRTEREPADMSMPEARAPGSSEIGKLYKAHLEDQARIIAGTKGVGNPVLLRQVANKLQQADVAKADEVIKTASVSNNGAAPVNAAGWRSMKTEIKALNAAMLASGEKADEFLGHLRTVGPGYDEWLRSMESNYLHQGNDPEAKQTKAKLAAMNRFHQLLNGKIVDYYHNMFGGAMSEKELELGSGVISKASSWQQIGDFVDQQDRGAQNYWRAHINSVPYGPRQIIRIRFGLGNPGSDTKGVPKESSESQYRAD